MKCKKGGWLKQEQDYKELMKINRGYSEEEKLKEANKRLDDISKNYSNKKLR